MVSRHSKPLLAFGIALLLMRCGLGQDSMLSPILARDVDKRPLPQVSLSALSPKMRVALRAMENEAKQDTGMSGAVQFTVRQIPVAPRDHKLFLVQLLGEDACSGTGVNCWLAVSDETQDNVSSVVQGQMADVYVIRRPHLQLPDIGVREQLGHFGNDMTVYRFSKGEWSPYACKETSITGSDDPHPEFVADRKCTP